MTSATSAGEAPDKEQEEQPPQEEEKLESPEQDEQKEEGASSSALTSEESVAAEPSQWQAVWAPQYNAYYFFNPVTQETTWSNPLQPEAEASSSAATEPEPASTEDTAAEAGPVLSAVAAHHAALQAAAIAQGIDPLLAHLDPTLLSSVPGSSSAVPGDVPTFKAQFNAHTGQFAPNSSRTPGHMSEYERAKRMSEFYFDVGKWEEELAKGGGSIRNTGAVDGDEEDVDGTGKKRKRPTKKDLERFKEQKKQKKIAKTAWLRS